MNVEIEAETALFPEKEYINGIADAVHTGWQADTTILCQIRLYSPDTLQSWAS
jgi:hypothetical protein